MLNISVKRAYDKQAKTDGTRVLVDRLWPRGVSKAAARIDIWTKDIAPSNELRKWFHADPDERWPEFKARYEHELKDNREAVEETFKSMKGHVTFITAAKDVEHSHVPVLRDFVERLFA